MQIILLEKVANLGMLGDIVKVKDGFGRNFLIPQGKAKRATEANKAEFAARRAELEKQQRGDTPQLALFDQSEPETASDDTSTDPDPIRERLEQIDPDELTPRQALDLLYELRKL